MKYLKKDLERLYYFEGQPDRKVTSGTVCRSVLHPRFLPVVLCRLAHVLYRRNHITLARLVSLINYHYFSVEVAMRCEIGPGLYFPHTVGTVVGASQIGCNAVIYHGVTLGAKDIDWAYLPEKRPVVGDNVVLGSGAKILGGITLGDNVIVGANAVVTHSVPANSVVGGIPGRILRSRDTKTDLEIGKIGGIGDFGNLICATSKTISVEKIRERNQERL